MPAIVKEKNNLIDVGLEYNLIGCGFSTNTNLRPLVLLICSLHLPEKNKKIKKKINKGPEF
jgi:hypothetical protein